MKAHEKVLRLCNVLFWRKKTGRNVKYPPGFPVLTADTSIQYNAYLEFFAKWKLLETMENVETAMENQRFTTAVPTFSTVPTVPTSHSCSYVARLCLATYIRKTNLVLCVFVVWTNVRPRGIALGAHTMRF